MLLLLFSLLLFRRILFLPLLLLFLSWLAAVVIASCLIISRKLCPSRYYPCIGCAAKSSAMVQHVMGTAGVSVEHDLAAMLLLVR